jgi:hypothetical protein
MFLKFGLNNKKSLHTLPLRSVPFHISPSLSLPLQTLRLVSMVSLINKTKRIADRSATNCDTHTPSHTDRQSTLDKYMINLKNIGEILSMHVVSKHLLQKQIRLFGQLKVCAHNQDC